MCFIQEADFRNAAEVERVVWTAAGQMGRLDLVVNNAAIMPPRMYQYEYTAEHIDEVLSVNYRGYMLIMRDAIRYWIKNNCKGSIVNIDSESAVSSHQKFSLYGGIKAAILRSSANAALDAAPYGIRINCVLPGCIDTLSEDAVKENRVKRIRGETQRNICKAANSFEKTGDGRGDWQCRIVAGVGGGLLYNGR